MRHRRHSLLRGGRRRHATLAPAPASVRLLYLVNLRLVIRGVAVTVDVSGPGPTSTPPGTTAGSTTPPWLSRRTAPSACCLARTTSTSAPGRWTPTTATTRFTVGNDGTLTAIQRRRRACSPAWAPPPC